MSAPSSPGEAISVSASRSAATTASAPLACSAAIAGLQVAHRARCAGILQQAAEHFRVIEIGEGIADDQIPAQRLGAGAQHRERLRMHFRVDEERFCLRLRGALGERHGLGGSRCLIEQRGVGDVEPGEVADHGLEIEQRLQPALADLRLIRRVGRVPGRALQNVALDHRGQDGAGIALADQRGEHLVLRGELAHMRQRLGFAERAPEIERRLLPDRGRQRLAHQLSEAVRADAVQHRADVAGRGADMPAHEIGGGFCGGFQRRVHGCLAEFASVSSRAGGIQYAGKPR